MTREKIVEKINAFLIEDFEIEEAKLIAGGRIKEDIGIDSLDIVDIIVAVHDTFNIKLNQTDFRDVKTLDEFYDLIQTKINA